MTYEKQEDFPMPIDKQLLDILACPKCKGKLDWRKSERPHCHTCRLKYRIEADRSCSSTSHPEK